MQCTIVLLGGNTGAMSYTTIHYAVSWVAMSYSLRRGRENAAVNKRSSDIWTHFKTSLQFSVMDILRNSEHTTP